jgi:FkbM family methyltransferase
VKSVYAPLLLENKIDYQLYLCATGKSGFKLANLLSKVNSETVFFDIGANMGLYSLIAAKNIHIKKIIAIEPNPILIKNFKKNIKANAASRIEIIEGAVSDSISPVALQFSDWHIGMGSLLRPGENSIKVKSLNRNFFDEISESIAENIFVKIDVEGFENIVVNEIFQSKLSKKISKVFVEISPKWLNTKKVERIYTILFQNGFKLKWKGGDEEQYDAFFVKDDIYKKIDQELAFNLSSPKYSICVSNFNMKDTIYEAISSVAMQLDDRFEILIIDDCSSDDSKNEICKLENDFPIVRSIFLEKDKTRLLGETRNISVYAAVGDYVLLHIDADDRWDPFINDFITLFHELEKAYAYDFLLVGQQVGIVKKNIFLGYGGYENIYRGEDRSLMFKFAKAEKIIFIDFKVFRQRLKRPKRKKNIKVFWDTWSHLKFDITYAESRFKFVSSVLFLPLKINHFSYKVKLLRFSLIIPALLSTLTYKRKALPMSWDDFTSYRVSHRGNFQELMMKVGEVPDLNQLVSKNAVRIFEFKSTNIGFKSE